MEIFSAIMTLVIWVLFCAAVFGCTFIVFCYLLFGYAKWKGFLTDESTPASILERILK